MCGFTSQLDDAAQALDGASSVLVITGAGLSADSGMPTYRGVGGLYHDVHTSEGVPIEVALSGDMFRSRPEITWKYLLQIGDACRGRSPNRGHEVIALFEQRFDRAWILTQNVDGFHRTAGSQNVIDIHGDLHDLRCLTCDHLERIELDAYIGDEPPNCVLCGAAARPEVVLFGEMLPMDKVSRLEAELRCGFDVVLSIGTSSLFPYISQPVRQVASGGGTVIEINPDLTDVSGYATIALRLGAAEALDAIWSRMSPP